MIHAIALELKKLRISKGISQENLSFSSGLKRQSFERMVFRIFMESSKNLNNV